LRQAVTLTLPSLWKGEGKKLWGRLHNSVFALNDSLALWEKVRVRIIFMSVSKRNEDELLCGREAGCLKRGTYGQ
jgi:hypothetical protein